MSILTNINVSGNSNAKIEDKKLDLKMKLLKFSESNKLKPRGLI